MKISKIKFYILPFFILLLISNSTCQENKHQSKTLHNSEFIDIYPKNIILMIGDGMGTSQIYAGMIAKKGHLNLERFPIVGFSKTYAADDLITDSAASGTAMATGTKTNNGMIGVDPNNVPVENIIEIAEKNGKGTGLVATSTITHATPASFIAHVESRNDYERIALQFLDTDIDVFIGGGSVHFIKRLDRRDLTKDLKKSGYSICQSLEELDTCTGDKIAGLVYQASPPSIMDQRGDMLSIATNKAIEVLDKNDEGFFLMIESSQIDWASHQNSVAYVTREMIDFDDVIGDVLKFAQKDGETLVIVTADHETGGMGIHGGDLSKGMLEAGFTTMGHTGVMVPVFAYGPKAELFSGIYDNTEIFHKMLKAFFKKLSLTE
jgi:alkaline phosphatase